MLLAVIVVSYNTAALTLAAVKAALTDIEGSQILKGKADIWVVDNHSTDNSVAKLKALAKNSTVPLKIIENESNPGFASANNQAITRSTGEYVLLLNSDTLVKAGALEHMVSTFTSQPTSSATAVLSSWENKIDNLGILSGQLLNPDGSPQAQGGSFPTLTSLAAHMLFLDDIPVIGKFLPSTQHTGNSARFFSSSELGLQPKDWVGGTVMMLKRSMIAEIGLLDDHIFMYGEDVEYCLRAHHHHYDCAIDLQAEIIHYGSASSSSKNAIIGELKGYRYIWSKHKPLWQIPLARVILILGCLFRILVFGTILHNSTKLKAYSEALKAV